MDTRLHHHVAGLMSARRGPRPKRADDNKRKCETGKRRYTGRKAALSAAQVAEYKPPGGLNIYKCPHCRGWHLTKKQRLPPPGNR